MSSATFDFAPGLPPPAVRWNGRVKFDFTGGNNDPDRVPVDGLIAAAESVLKREGRMLAIYGVNQGPQGYRPLREFLAGKLKADAGIACIADDILPYVGRIPRSISSTARCSRAATPSSSKRTATRARSTGSPASA
jgi:2-aminoadipate transaminase